MSAMARSGTTPPGPPPPSETSGDGGRRRNWRPVLWALLGAVVALEDLVVDASMSSDSEQAAPTSGSVERVSTSIWPGASAGVFCVK